MRNKTKRVTLVGSMAVLVLSFYFSIPINSLAMGKKVEQFPNPVGHFEKGPYLNEARHDHTATLLDDGNVLIAGGAATEKWEYPKSAELYVSKRNMFIRINGLKIPRKNHAAVKLNNGKVLFFGGSGPNVLKGKELDTVEEYDPQTQKFSIVGKMLDMRWFCQAVLLDNGKIFIYGGAPWGSKGQWHCELYDPITNTSQYTAKMHYLGIRRGNIIAKLTDGRIFMKIGTPHSPEEEEERRIKKTHTIEDKPNRLGAIEIYDPKTDQFELKYELETSSGGMCWPLQDDVILLIDQEDPNPNRTRYSLITNIFNFQSKKTTFIGKLSAEQFNNLILIKNRYVLIAGLKDKSNLYDSMEAIDIKEHKIIQVGPMNILRGGATLTQLPNGNILVAGGYYYKTGKRSKRAEIFKVEEP